ncbi:hypothetical protein K7A41_07690 [Sphingobacterium sp. InxBP1]|uniref:hypothetical protein n=1 Tax=Sphingobacterium sp. InxBP1 TaxID=2870328 RepID=UPI002243B074|nr:hypothetical protein [Sphingobacterium sp. InxBP1]MCW8311100.1 hypothetical protein [Sphingobacterium sp. InxBP1]
MKRIFILFSVLGLAFDTKGQSNAFPASGNVGIGTTAPQSKLQVIGGLSVNGRNPSPGINGFGNAIQLVDPSHAAILYNPGQSTELMYGFHSNGSMYWGHASAYSMSLTKNGDLRVMNTLAVGHGLKSGSKMSVAGKLSAQEVEVTTSNWPDYVFRSGYNLPRLSDIEKFIKENGHLPEVPKASEVEANGLQLGEMNKILLKKIEELTLQAIADEKVRFKQQELLEQQARAISEMQRRLDRLEREKSKR